MQGIYTSHYQQRLIVGNVDCESIICKATEGDSLVDPSCDKHIQQAIRKKIPWGFGHFARPDLGDPETQAKFFVDNTLGYIGQGIMRLDWDRNWGDTNWPLRWLMEVFRLTNVRPIIYMNIDTLLHNDWGEVVKNNFGLAIADWENLNQKAPKGQWPFIIMRQYTCSGKIAGYDSNICKYEFYGDKETWKKYAALASAPPSKSKGSTAPKQAPQPQTTPHVAPSQEAEAPHIVVSKPKNKIATPAHDTRAGVTKPHRKLFDLILKILSFIFRRKTRQ